MLQKSLCVWTQKVLFQIHILPCSLGNLIQVTTLRSRCYDEYIPFFNKKVHKAVCKENQMTKWLPVPKWPIISNNAEQHHQSAITKDSVLGWRRGCYSAQLAASWPLSLLKLIFQYRSHNLWSFKNVESCN